MGTLCIQVQPSRSPALDLVRLRLLVEEIAGDHMLVSRFQFNEGIDSIPYINVMFETDRLSELWKTIYWLLYNDVSIGVELREASMAMCEGDKGWDNYLQLHHFNPKVELDSLDAR
jgi:hypothetical protein